MYYCSDVLNGFKAKLWVLPSGALLWHLPLLCCCDLPVLPICPLFLTALPIILTATHITSFFIRKEKQERQRKRPHLWSYTNMDQGKGADEGSATSFDPTPLSKEEKRGIPVLVRY